MKRLYFLLFCMIALMSCQSPGKKAEKLIKAYMFKSLYDYNSYEATETKIDSCYNSIFYDTEAQLAALAAKESIEEAQEYKEDLEDAEYEMNLWYDNRYMTHYGKSRYKSAKEDYNEARKRLLEAQISSNENLLQIKQKSIDYNTDFIGWEVMHSFRCNTRGGDPSLGNYTFIINKDFTEIINVIDKDDQSTMEATIIIATAMSLTVEDLESNIQEATEMLNKL